MLPLARALDLSSLEALNHQFTAWAEEHYNAQLHSVLGLSSLDRFALDRNRVRFLPPNEVNDELFFVEEERHVRADNTFSFKAVRFEAPRHLPERTIQIRFERQRPAARVIVYYRANAWPRPAHSMPSPMIGRRKTGPRRPAAPHQEPLPRCLNRSRTRPGPHGRSQTSQPCPHPTPREERL